MVALIARQLLMFGALMLAAGARAADPAPERVLDRVVAVVDGRPITLTELEFEARVALVRRGAVRAAEEPLDTQTLRSALDYAIAQRIQVAEAEKLEAYGVDPQEVQKAIDEVRERLGPAGLEAFLERQESDVQALGEVLHRELRAARILDGKVRLRAQVTEGELRRAYDARAAELGRPFDEVRAQLRERLVRERYQALVRAEIDELLREADVRRLGAFAAGGSP